MRAKQSHINAHELFDNNTNGWILSHRAALTSGIHDHGVCECRFVCLPVSVVLGVCVGQMLVTLETQARAHTVTHTSVVYPGEYIDQCTLYNGGGGDLGGA